MIKKLCAALLCLLLAGLWGCGERDTQEPSEEEFAEEFTQPITKIDLSAPESKKYRDWLEAYYESTSWEQEVIEPSSTSPKTPKPDIKDSKEHFSFLVDGEGPAKEGWRTWDWNDIWELEAYSVERNIGGWYVLRARNKATGETQLIDEVAADIAESFGADFQVVHIEETYIVYSFGDDYGGWSYSFYAPGQAEGQRISVGSMNEGFLDEACTKWWYMDYVTLADDDLDNAYKDVSNPREELDDEGFTKWWHWAFDSVLYYIDLPKLAVGDADAQREIIRGADFCTNVWMAERDGRSVICFSVKTAYPYKEEGSWRDPYYIGIYDPQENRIQDYLEAPKLDMYEIVAIRLNRFYAFTEASIFSEAGERKPYFDGINFYVINLDI